MEDKEGRKGMHDNSTQGGHTVMYHGRAVPDSSEENSVDHCHKSQGLSMFDRRFRRAERIASLQVARAPPWSAPFFYV